MTRSARHESYKNTKRYLYVKKRWPAIAGFSSTEAFAKPNWMLSAVSV